MTIVALGLVAGVLWIGTALVRDRLNDQQVALIRGTAQLRVAVTDAHLWLEEYVSGDPDVKFADIQRRLDEAQQLVGAMLEGGEAYAGGIQLKPLDEAPLRRRAEEIKKLLEQLRERALHRRRGLERGEDIGIGSPVDTAFDWTFHVLLESARELETAVDRARVRNERQAAWMVAAVFLAWCSLIGVAAVALGSRERRRREVEEALRRSETQLLQVQKMEAVGRLAGGLAHDVNNFITAITSQCELVKMKPAPAERVQKKMDLVIGTAGKVTALIRQLLAFARQQPSEPRRVDLNEVVAGLSGIVKRLLGEDMELETFLAGDLWPTRIDPSQVEQIVVNLLVNAREASPSGGKVTVETANVVLDRQYLARNPVAKPGDFVLLAVSDTGAGIAPDIRDKIFEPFFTTKAKETSEARGLGLATIYGIARQNGGHISVYSEVGKGTTFKVYLPRSHGEAEPLAAAASSGHLLRGGESVLLVEDNDDLRESVADILDQLGYRVRVAADGEQGLAALSAGGPVDLVISDVVMPGLSGQEMARRIRETQPELPILFISGYTDNVVLRHGLLEGTFAFLEKPFTAERLGSKIREVLRETAA